VELADGAVWTVHCPNPGSMRGLSAAGMAVRCSDSANPARRLRHTLEMVRPGRAWVGVHTGRANALAELSLRAGRVPALAGYRTFQREPRLASGSRLDLRLEGHPRDARPAFVEVKSVTLAEGREARFPDSPTERGRRHLEELETLARAGARAALLFVVQRADCDRVAPADDIDPRYGEALRRAARSGVELHALRVRVTSRALSPEGTLPVRL